MAVLILLSLLSGGIAPLSFHVGTGTLILVLLTFRLLVRYKTGKPSVQTSRLDLQKRLAKWMHASLYVLLGIVVATGAGIAVEADLFHVMQGKKMLPGGFTGTILYKTHATATDLLLIAAALHVLAAIWHQFVQRDGIFARMWFSNTIQSDARSSIGLVRAPQSSTSKPSSNNHA